MPAPPPASDPRSGILDASPAGEGADDPRQAPLTEAPLRPGSAVLALVLALIGAFAGALAGDIGSQGRWVAYFLVALAGALGAFLASDRARVLLLFPPAFVGLLAIQRIHEAAADRGFLGLWDTPTVDPPPAALASVVLALIAVMVSCAVRRSDNLRDLGDLLHRAVFLDLRGTRARYFRTRMRSVDPDLGPRVLLLLLLVCLATAFLNWDHPALESRLWMALGGALLLIFLVPLIVNFYLAIREAMQEGEADALIDEWFLILSTVMLLLLTTGADWIAWVVLGILLPIFAAYVRDLLTLPGLIIHGCLGLAAGSAPLFHVWAEAGGPWTWATFGLAVALLAAAEIWCFAGLRWVGRLAFEGGAHGVAHHAYAALSRATRGSAEGRLYGRMAATSALRAGRPLEAAHELEGIEAWAQAGEVYLRAARRANSTAAAHPPASPGAGAHSAGARVR